MIRLSSPTGHSVSSGIPTEDYVDIRLMALSNGVYTDMNGTKVTVTQETLEKIRDKYNDKAQLDYNAEKQYNKKMGDISEFDNRNAPNQIGHNDSDPRETVGHVIGLMEVTKSGEKSYLFMTVRVKGKENIPMVTGKTARWRNVSVQFSTQTHEFSEVSWVVKGADMSARSLLSKLAKPEYFEINNMIKLAKDTISKYNDIIDADEILLSACKKGIITKAQSNEISSSLSKFSNPSDVVRLFLSAQSTLEFNPMFINREHIPTKLGGK